MKKIKVLHITQSVIGGTLEYLKLFFKFIDKEKFDIELICPSYGPMKDEILNMGIKVHTIEMVREISPKEDYKSYLELKKYIRDNKPDIIHLHSSKAGVLGRLANRNLKVPCIYNPHGWSFSMDVSSKKKWFYAIIERYCAKYTDKIINISENEQKIAIEYNIASLEKMQIIYNGIDLDKYNKQYNRQEVFKELGIPKDSYIIGMVGRLSKQKSPKTFISIANEIKKCIDNAYFVLVGDGELRDEVENLIKQYKLDNQFLITGWTNEVPKYISIFNVALLTSRWEGFGLVLAEYMVSRKPIVASNVGGIPNLIKNNYNGILVDSMDIHGFTEGILKINKSDKFNKYIVDNGYNDVNSKFNIKRVIQEHEKLYESYINIKNG